jgi:predicted dehydrogenase
MHWMRYVVGEVAAVSASARTFEPLRFLRDTQGQVTQQVRAEVDDTYLATLLFERGALGQLWWSWAMRAEPVDIPGAPAVLGSKGAVRGGDIQLEDGRRLPLQDEFERALSASEREQLFPLGLRDPYAIQQLDWLRAIDRGGDPETSGEEGLRDLACAFAMLESSALGRQVTLAEMLDGRADGYQREIDEHYGLLV